MNIFPSILETDINEFKKEILHLSPLFSYVQIDIADGKLVPHKTIQIEEIISLITHEQLPISNLACEFHLMVENYDREMEKLHELSVNIHIQKVLIHLQAITHEIPFSDTFEVGIVLNPEDDVLRHYEFISTSKTIQIMTVHPGFHGKPFLPESLEKINQLREKGYTGLITLDGGLNEETIKIVMQNKYLPDAIFPGSYLKENTEERLRLLQSITR